MKKPLEEVLKEATPGPLMWSSNTNYEGLHGSPAWALVGDGGYGVLCCDGLLNSPQGLGAQGAADAALLAHFRNVGPELVEALEKAISEAESWVKDQLDGTMHFNRAMEELQPLKDTLSRAKEVEVP